LLETLQEQFPFLDTLLMCNNLENAHQPETTNKSKYNNLG